MDWGRTSEEMGKEINAAEVEGRVEPGSMSGRNEEKNKRTKGKRKKKRENRENEEVKKAEQTRDAVDIYTIVAVKKEAMMTTTDYNRAKRTNSIDIHS